MVMGIEENLPNCSVLRGPTSWSYLVLPDLLDLLLINHPAQTYPLRNKGLVRPFYGRPTSNKPSMRPDISRGEYVGGGWLIRHTRSIFGGPVILTHSDGSVTDFWGPPGPCCIRRCLTRLKPGLETGGNEHRV